MRNIKKILYTAGVLYRQDQMLNISKFSKIKPYDQIFCHHMTIQYEGLGNSLPWYIGIQDTFKVDYLVYDDKAMALLGRPEDEDLWDVMLDLKQQPHITLGAIKGVPPVYSDAMIASSESAKIKLNMELDIICGAYCILEDTDEAEWIYSVEDLIER